HCHPFSVSPPSHRQFAVPSPAVIRRMIRTVTFTTHCFALAQMAPSGHRFTESLAMIIPGIVRMQKTMQCHDNEGFTPQCPLDSVKVHTNFHLPTRANPDFASIFA